MDTLWAFFFSPPKLASKFRPQSRAAASRAEKQILTILFTDIADFTSLTQGWISDELAVS
jgi:hypothetical protein